MITETRLRRKHLIKKETVDRNKNTRAAHEKYEKLLSQYAKEKKAQKDAAKKEAAQWAYSRLTFPSDAQYSPAEWLNGAWRCAVRPRLYTRTSHVSNCHTLESTMRLLATPYVN